MATSISREGFEDLLLEIQNAGENIAACFEWGSGSDAARKEADDLRSRALLVFDQLTGHGG